MSWLYSYTHKFGYRVQLEDPPHILERLLCALSSALVAIPDYHSFEPWSNPRQSRGWPVIKSELCQIFFPKSCLIPFFRSQVLSRSFVKIMSQIVLLSFCHTFSQNMPWLSWSRSDHLQSNLKIRFNTIFPKIDPPYFFCIFMYEFF